MIAGRSAVTIQRSVIRRIRTQAVCSVISTSVGYRQNGRIRAHPSVAKIQLARNAHADLRLIFMATSVRIPQTTLTFLADLEAHNEKPWFEANKARYHIAHANMVAFAETLLERMRTYDKTSTPSGARSLMRIHTDQRFHKEKPPYAPRFGGRLVRVKPQLRGGYFFKIQPGGRSHATCGFMGPEPADLRLIRQDIHYDQATWRKILRGRQLRGLFGDLTGEKVATIPRGYAKDHPAADLLRKRQFLLRRTFTDEEVLAPDFGEELVRTFRAVRPWFDHMTAVLTSDGNGA